MNSIKVTLLLLIFTIIGFPSVAQETTPSSGVVSDTIATNKVIDTIPPKNTKA